MYGSPVNSLLNNNDIGWPKFAENTQILFDFVKSDFRILEQFSSELKNSRFIVYKRIRLKFKFHLYEIGIPHKYQSWTHPQ